MILSPFDMADTPSRGDLLAIANSSDSKTVQAARSLVRLTRSKQTHGRLDETRSQPFTADGLSATTSRRKKRGFGRPSGSAVKWSSSLTLTTGYGPGQRSPTTQMCDPVVVMLLSHLVADPRRQSMREH